MAFELDENGLSIQTFDEILDETQDEFRSRISTTIATALKSFAGQMQRILALKDQQGQERLLLHYQNLDARTAEGVHLDQRSDLSGVTRLAAQPAEVLGTATATEGTVLPNGSRVSVGGFEFAFIDGPYTVGTGGTLSNVRVRSTLLQAIDVSTLGAWTIVDAISGFTAFDDDTQPQAGRLLETDTELRARTEIERFRRATGPLLAIDANVRAVNNVTFARAAHHVDPALGDPDPVTGIPLYAINTVVEGGDDTEVAQAIQDAGPAGSRFFGTDVTVTLGVDTFTQDVSFDRVTAVPIDIIATLTTSTSEETTPDTATLEAAIDAALLAFTTTTWVIGKDVLPGELEAAIFNAGILGIDAIVVTVSTDNGVLDPFSTAKRPISIRQRAGFSVTRVTVVET